MIDATDRPRQRTGFRAGSARRRRSATASDGVIAAYIHELHHAGRPRAGSHRQPSSRPNSSSKIAG